MTKDEATRAHRAAVKLRRLYHAHRANSRAIGMTIHRTRSQLAENANVSDAERGQLQQALTQQFAHAQALDIAMAERIAGLNIRLAELREWMP